MLTGDVRRGDVGEAPQAAARLTAVGEFEHAQSSLHVDLECILQTQLKGHRRRAVHDLAHPLGEPVEPPPQAQTGARDIARHRDHPL